VIARIDLITAKAKHSHDYRMSAPELNDEGPTLAASARHPLLSTLSAGRRRDERAANGGAIEVAWVSASNLLVITGPNTGGKTVTLRRRPSWP